MSANDEQACRINSNLFSKHDIRADASTITPTTSILSTTPINFNKNKNFTHFTTGPATPTGPIDYKKTVPTTP